MDKQTTADKIAHADYMASKWLADGNEQAERGNHVKAEKCYEKSTFWLARLNKLTGNH